MEELDFNYADEINTSTYKMLNAQDLSTTTERQISLFGKVSSVDLENSILYLKAANGNSHL